MKLKIKVKRYSNNAYVPKVFNNGDWIDLANTEEIKIKPGEFKKIPLGVIIKLPKGFEANVLPRSSTYGKFSLIQTNSKGIIDETYCGPTDEWKFPVRNMSTKTVTIPAKTRICQFRITLSQKANVRQKLKWLFCNGVEIEEITSLSDTTDRGGFGSTGSEG